jgi:CxxC motif-containing protein (DUF1111 family)
MKVARSLFVLTPLVMAIVFSWTTGRSSAHGSRFEFGKPLEGLNMDQRKLFREGKDAFEELEEEADGLGPIFNAKGCAFCHSSPAVGGSAPFNETRAGRVQGGVFFDLPGGSLFQSDGINPNCKETIPSDANVIAPRQITPLFGLGLIEAIPDWEIEAYRAFQARAFPAQAGRTNRILDIASGQTRVGRFGWKNQQASLLGFSADAYLNEMGITSRLLREENAPNGDIAKLRACDSVPDPEDGEDDITLFTNFMRLLGPPPRDQRRFDADRERDGNRDGNRDGGPLRGERVFELVGCGVCHRSGFVARSRIEAIDGQRVAAYSDFLLHDVGTGDGIVQAGAKANELRTPPLWGVSESAPFLHDGSAPTLRDAIARHGNQGAAARAAFDRLPSRLQEALLEFLDSI